MSEGRGRFIQHVLGGHQGFGELKTMVLPARTVLLELQRAGPGGLIARPHATTKDLHLTIRGHFVEAVEWDDLEGAETEI